MHAFFQLHPRLILASPSVPVTLIDLLPVASFSSDKHQSAPVRVRSNQSRPQAPRAARPSRNIRGQGPRREPHPRTKHCFSVTQTPHSEVFLCVDTLLNVAPFASLSPALSLPFSSLSPSLSFLRALPSDYC